MISIITNNIKELFVIIINMIFRDSKTGKLVIINRQDYHCDTDYYTAICNTMNIDFPKSNNEYDRIIKMINSKKTR